MRMKLLAICGLGSLTVGCESTNETFSSAWETTKSAVGESASTLFDGSSESTVVSGNFTINPIFAAYDPMMGAYATSMLGILSAQEIWLKAIGKAELAAELAAQRLELEQGGELTADRLDTFTELSTKTEILLAETKRQEKKLTQENGMLFATGFLPYAAGVVQAKKVVIMAPQYAKSLQASALDITQASQNLVKAKAMYDLGRNGPAFLTTLYSTSKLVIEYSKDQDIKMPSELAQLNDIADMAL